LKIAICIPSGDDWKADFGYDLAAMVLHTTANAPFSLSIGIFNHRLSVLPTSRNRLVQDALKTGADWILFLDSDMRFPPDTLLRLLSYDRDIVAANCVLRAFPTRATAWGDGAHVFTAADADGLEEVESIGTAVMLIRSSVFARLPPPAFKFEDKPDDPFSFLGEDQYFCRKARECGFRIWIDHGLSQSVAHVGTLAYTMNMARLCRDGTPTLLNGLNLNRSTSAPAVVKDKP
jgi:glycosyltransferase involved in cell wall biosynthesis